MRGRQWGLMVVALLVPAPGVAQQSQMAFTLAEGPYRAGFRNVNLTDPTRSWSGDVARGPGPRPLQVSIWYPARPAAGERPMRYAEYLELRALEGGAAGYTAEARARAIAMALPGDSLHRWNESGAPTRAYRDAPAAAGRFPVVLYAPSFNAPSTENSVLAEYLASQGYVVIASPCMGWFGRFMEETALGVEAQVRDLAVLLEYARRLPEADTTQVAAMGFSWGGISNVVFAAREPRVRALVSLDGTIAYRWRLFRASVAGDPALVEAPFLFLQSAAMPIDTARKYGVDTIPAVFDSLPYADLYRVQFHQLVHQNFGAEFVRLLPRGLGEESQATVNYGFEQIARYVLAFLDAKLKGSREGAAFLARTPDANGVRERFATATPIPGRHPAEHLMAFGRALGAGGAARAPEVLAEIRRSNPRYTLPEMDVNTWGYTLLAAGRVAEAIGVFTLNTVLYPQSGNVWDSLGEATAAGGDVGKAIEYYEKSLGLDPGNENARRQIRRLRGVGGTW